MKELEGKVAVVTGAASGIGRALAERFARERMHVVLADVEEAPLAEATAALASNGAKAIGVRTDVSRGADVEALRARAVESFGAVHVLCNNAGVGLGGMMWDRSVAEWEWILGVNLWGVIHGVRAFVPGMIAQGEGHVVNTASIAGLISVAAVGPYCVTKHAVVTLSECLHHDLALAAGGAVKVSVLCPGFVKTRVHESARNKPAHAVTEDRPPNDVEKMIGEAMRTAVENGMEPAIVADHVLSAIKEERFYVFTHPKLKKAFERRANEILEEKTPTFDPTMI